MNTHAAIVQTLVAEQSKQGFSTELQKTEFTQEWRLVCWLSYCAGKPGNKNRIRTESGES